MANNFDRKIVIISFFHISSSENSDPFNCTRYGMNLVSKLADRLLRDKIKGVRKSFINGCTKMKSCNFRFQMSVLHCRRAFMKSAKRKNKDARVKGVFSIRKLWCSMSYSFLVSPFCVNVIYVYEWARQKYLNVNVNTCI